VTAIWPDIEYSEFYDISRAVAFEFEAFGNDTDGYGTSFVVYPLNLSDKNSGVRAVGGH
jgi:hypothetical protein